MDSSFRRFLQGLQQALRPVRTGPRARRKLLGRPGRHPQVERLEDRITPTTTLTFANHVLTINVGANAETARLSVDATELLSVTSTAATSADAGAQGLGFAAATGANAANTGSIAAGNDVRRIDITGAAGTQTVDFQGGAGLFTAVNLNDGAIENVVFDTAASTFAKVSANAPTADLVVAASTLSQSQSIATQDNGNISLTVTGANETIGAAVTAGGTGTVTLTALAPDATLTNNAAVTGSIATLNADRMVLTGGTVNAGTGNIALETVSAGRLIDLGSTTDAAVNTLEVSNAELATLTAGQIALITNSGNLKVTAAITAPGALTTLALASGGTITEAAGGTLGAFGLFTQSVGGTKLDKANTVTAFGATNTTGGDISLTNATTDLAINGISQSGGGNVSVNNTGGIVTRGAITTAADGNISLTASGALTIGIAAGVTAGGAGTVTLTATGAASDVVLFAPVRSTSGALTLTAGRDLILNNPAPTGGSLSTAGAVQLTAAGEIIELDTGAISAGTLTTVSTTGTVLTAANTVSVFNATNNAAGSSGNVVLANAGVLQITGIALAGGGSVGVDNTGDVSTTGAITTDGNISLTVLGADGTLTNNVAVTGAGATLTADRMILQGGTVNVGPGTIILQPLSTGRLIDLGSTTDVAANTLELSQAELATLTAGQVQVGNSLSGDITITAALTAPAGFTNLSLVTGGQISEGPNGSLSGFTLTTTAPGGLNLGGPNTLASFGATNANGADIVLNDNVPTLTITGISQTGTTAPGGNIMVTNAGAIVTTGAITTAAAGGNITLNSGPETFGAAVAAGTGTIGLTSSGAITTTGAAVLSGARLALKTATGIGTAGTALATAVSNLAFQNTAGVVNIANTGALTITVVGALMTSINTGTTTTLSAASPITFAVDTSSVGTLTATAVDDTPGGGNDNITVNAGKTVKSTGGDVVFQAGDDINVQNTATVQGQNVTLASAFNDNDQEGAQTLDGTVRATAATGVVTLNLGAFGPATQAATGSIQANGLVLLGTGAAGSFTLTSALNQVARIAAATAAAINFQDSVALVVDTVNGTPGITATGSNITLTVNGTLTQTAAIIGATLTTSSVGDTTLTNAGNAVTGFNATTTTSGNVSLTNTAAPLTITGISAVGNVTVNNTGALTTTGAITGANISLTASGTETIGAAVTAADPGTVTLTANGMATDVVIGGVVSTVSGKVTILAGHDIQANADVTSTSGDIAATAGNNLTLNAGDLITGGNVTLTATAGAINEADSGFINAATLTTKSATGTTLPSTNTVGTFTATNSTSGDVTLNNGTALTIAGITETGGGKVVVSNSSTITTTGTISTAANGNITLTAAGSLTVGAAVTAGGTGTVTLTVTGADGTLTNNAAVAGGNATLTADRLILQTGTVNVGMGTIILQPFSAGRLIDLGSTTDAAANTLEISQAEFNTLTGGQVQVGSTTSGDLTVTAALTAPAGFTNLSLVSGGKISEGPNGSLSGFTLTTSAGNGVNLGGPNMLATFGATNSNGANIVFNDNVPTLTITGISQTGTTAPGGNIMVTNTGAIVTTGLITTAAAGGNITLTATGGNETIGAPVTAGTGTIILISGGAITTTGTGVLSGASLALTAATGIGTAITPLATAVSNLAFQNTAGVVNIANTGALTITIVGGLMTSFNNGTTTTLSAASPITFAVNTTSAGTLTVTAVDDTPGGSNDNITVNAGVTVQSTGGDVVFQAGDDIVINGTVLGNNITLASAFGDNDQEGALTLNGTVMTNGFPGAGIITLNLGAFGPASEGPAGSIQANQLLLLSTGPLGAFTLTSTHNTVVTLAAATAGDINYRNTTALVIGTVAGTAGITAPGRNVTLTTGGALTQTAPIVSATLTAKTLNDAGAAITLTNAANAVGTVDLRARNAADTANAAGALAFTDTGNLVVATAQTTSTVTLTTTGTLTQTGPIVGTTLTTSSVGGTTLTNAGNAVTGFNATNTGGGDIQLTNTLALTISGISQTGGGSIVVTNGAAVTTTGPITTAANGNISLMANGTLTIGAVVTAGGSGAISLTATGMTGDVLINAAVSSGTGPITVSADRDLTVSNTGSITTGGTVTLHAGRTETLNGPVSGGTNNGNLTLTGVDIVISTAVNGGMGNVTATATNTLTVTGTGSVTTGGPGNIILTAGGGIETIGGPVSTTGSGNVTLMAATNLAINATVSANTGNVTATAGGTLTVGATGKVTTTGTAGGAGGNIQLTAGGGTETISGAVTAGNLGNVVLTANGAASDIVINAAVSSAMGSVTATAGQNLTVTATGSVSTGGPGAIGLTAGNGAVTVGGMVQAAGTGGVTLVAAGPAGNVVINATVSANTGNITATAAQSLTVGATGKVTTTGTPGAAGGNIQLTASNGLETLDGAVTAGNQGNVVLSASGATGDVLVDAAVSSGTGNISATASRDILLRDVAAPASVGSISTTATVTLTAGRLINEAGTGIITAGVLTTVSAAGTTLNNTNAVTSFNATNTTSGPISLKNAAALLTITGITESGGGDVTVTNTGGITTTGAVSTTPNGSITLAATGTETIGAGVTAGGSGTVKLTATGAASDIVINAPVSSGTGNITATAGRALTVAATGSVTTGGTGTISLVASGGTETLGGPISATGSGTVTLTATGATSDLIISAAVNSGSGNITATAGRTITLVDVAGSVGSLTTAAMVSLTAGAAITEAGTGIITANTLTTVSVTGTLLNNVNAVSNFNATNTGNGNIGFKNKGNLTITGISNTGGNVSVDDQGALTVGGNVSGSGAVTLTSEDLATGGQDLTVNAGVMIRSTGSTVTLQGGDNVTLLPGSTVEASGVLTIQGDFGSPDAGGVGTTIRIGGTVQSDNATINVVGGPDNDTFIIDNNAGAPNDGGTLVGIKSPITITGGGGTDSLVIDDTGAGGTRVTLTPTTLGATTTAPDSNNLFASGVGLTYAALTNLTLNLGAGGNTVFVRGTAPGTMNLINGGFGAGGSPGSSSNTFNVLATDGSSITTLNGNTGSNSDTGASTFNVGSLGESSPLSNVAGLVSINPMGGSGRDTLNVDDRADGVGRQGFLTASHVDGLGMGMGINFNRLSNLNLQLGQGSDTFTIDDSPAAVTTTLDTGAGNNVIGIEATHGRTSLTGGPGNDQFSFIGNLAQLSGGTINGGGGSNTLDYSRYTGSNGVVFANLTSNNPGPFVIPPGIPAPLGAIPIGGGQFAIPPLPVQSATGVGTTSSGPTGGQGGISNIQNVIGIDGDPTIAAPLPGGSNLLIGGQGSRLQGGGFHDILIGINGATLIGGGRGQGSTEFLMGFGSDPAHPNVLFGGSQADISADLPLGIATTVRNASQITLVGFTPNDANGLPPAGFAPTNILLINSCLELQSGNLLLALQPSGRGLIDLVARRTNDGDLNSPLKFLGGTSAFAPASTANPPGGVSAQSANAAPLVPQPADVDPEPGMTVLAASSVQGRGPVAAGFLTSTEYRTAQIVGYYQKFLGRTPDAAGLANWLGVLAGGGRLEDVLTGILSSGEYFVRNGSNDLGFIHGLYQDLLGRDPAQGEVSFWQNVLDRSSRSTVAMGFVTSDEYRTDLLEADYQHYLGRSADQVGLNSFLNAYHQGATQEQIQAAFLNSGEYQARVNARFGMDPDVAYVEGLYQDVLGRSAAMAEIAFWLHALQTL